jgi:hypothetical protein
VLDGWFHCNDDDDDDEDAGNCRSSDTYTECFSISLMQVKQNHG